MRKVIFSGAAFTVGNVAYSFVGDPKLFFVPLSFFLFFLLEEAHKIVTKDYEKAAIQWLLILSAGNIVKQLFYSEKIKQINDYGFGAVVTVWLLYKLGKIWATKGS